MFDGGIPNGSGLRTQFALKSGSIPHRFDGTAVMRDLTYTFLGDVAVESSIWTYQDTLFESTVKDSSTRTDRNGSTGTYYRVEELSTCTGSYAFCQQCIVISVDGAGQTGIVCRIIEGSG